MSTRFTKATDAAISECSRDTVAPNTLRTSNYAMRVFEAYLLEMGETYDGSKQQLSEKLPGFTVSARQQDGSCYRSSSLQTIVRGVVMAASLRAEATPRWDFDKDAEFYRARNALTNVLRKLQAALEPCGRVHVKHVLL